MGSEFESYYREMQSGLWANLNPSKCPCKGQGWVCSELDTWHRCRLHGAGVPHPDGEADLFNFANHTRQVCREAYAGFRARALAAGFKGNFKQACLRSVTPGTKMTPALWVDAAEEVAVQVEEAAEDAAAVRNGYSCGLEARLAQYALEESQGRMR